MATVTGNNGVNNTLTGTGGRDRIYGDTRSTLTTIGGNDTINALDGDDYIYGDAYRNITGASAKGGDDALYGDTGNDIIYGDGNYSLLNGALGGNDFIDGGIDDDIISGDVRIAITGAGSLGGNDTIDGSSGHDRVYGDCQGDITNGGQGGVDTVYGGFGNDRIYGDAGDDLINATGGGDFLYGEDGDDIIAGDAADDMTTGTVGGNDTLDGDIGNDTLIGDAGGNLLDGSQGGVDTITGGVGDDIIFGDAGEDLNNSAIGGNDGLDGGDNNDLISGDAGNELKNGSIGGDDNLQGGNGDDRLYGDAVDSFLISVVGGVDTIDGGLGADIISGDAGGSFYDNSQGGNDILMAGNDTTGGPNIIYGDAGNTIYLSSHGGHDTITGSGVTDIVYGDAGVDIYGNSTGGNDTINTLGGDDEISGDAGRSLFDFAVGGDDIINAGAGNDTIYGDARLLMRLNAQGGDDTIHGGDNDDIISGDAGHKLYQNAIGGDDTLYGDDGDDLIVGDTLEYITSGGQGGNDTIFGGDGDDIIHGDALRFISSTGVGGNDTLQGEAGNDIVYGDAGNDLLIYDWNLNNSSISYHDVYSGGSGTDTLEIRYSNTSDITNINSAVIAFTTFLGTSPSETTQFDFNSYGFDLLAIGFEVVIAIQTTTANDDDFDAALPDVAAITEEDGATNLDVLANDFEPDPSDTLSVIAVDTTIYSTLGSVTNNGVDVIYNPNGQFDTLSAGKTDTDKFIYTISDGNGNTDTATVTVTISGVNDPVNNLLLSVTDTVEDQSVTLTASFGDVDLLDTHNITVNWGDGNSQTFDLTVGDRGFSLNHTYLDDQPDTTLDDFSISVTIDDNQGSSVSDTTSTHVDNVAPSSLTLPDNNLTITENTALNPTQMSLTGLTFADPGTQDEHTISIDWNDGVIETFSLTVGDRSFDINHTFEEPGDYTAIISISDGDGGSTNVTLNVHVDCSLDVTTSVDGLTNDSLRDAIQCANEMTGTHDIITLTDLDNDGLPDTFILNLGELVITDDLTIIGQNTDTVTDFTIIEVDASVLAKFFSVNPGVTLHLENLTLSGASAGGILVDNGNLELVNVHLTDTTGGSAVTVQNDSSLTVIDSLLDYNSSGDSIDGGAVNVSNSNASISGSVFDNNYGRAGGAMVFDNTDVTSKTLTITDTDFTHNEAKLYGGALDILGASDKTVTIQGDSYFYDNGRVDNQGGAIASFGSNTNMTINDSTFDYNTGNQGGAILIASGLGNIVSLNNSVISNNTATGVNVNNGGDGAGIHITGNNSLYVNNSLISGNVTENGFGGGVMVLGRFAKAYFHDSTISGNEAEAGGGVQLNNRATAELYDSFVTGNIADQWGAGLRGSNGGNFLVNNSVVSGNNAVISGGGIYIASDQFNGNLTLINSSITGNTAIDDAGGIYLGGNNFSISNSTISDNTSALTSGIHIISNTSASIYNTTISGNTSSGTSGGAALEVSGTTLTLVNSTISANTGIQGGVLVNNSGLLSIGSTVIAQNNTDTDNQFFYDSELNINSNGYNFISNVGATVPAWAQATDFVGTDSNPLDAMLGALADNGGPTLTHLPDYNGPLVDAGAVFADSNYQGVPLLLDQRGFDREYIDGLPDIGAVEVQYAFHIDNYVVGTDGDDSPLNGDGLNNVILALEGNDQSFGNSGDDIFVFSPTTLAATTDTIWDFDALSDFEKIDLRDYNITEDYNTFVANHIFDYVGNPVIFTISLDSGLAFEYDTINVTITNGDYSNIDANDFLF